MNKTEKLNPVQLPEVKEAVETAQDAAATVRRAFVEPEVSFPVDVLEATTFFQAADSGLIPPP